jgi:hypothetical protein
MTLPDGSQITSDTKLNSGQFITYKGNEAYIADEFRKKIVDLPLNHAAVLPMGESKFAVEFPGTTELLFELTVWASGKGQAVGS